MTKRVFGRVYLGEWTFVCFIIEGGRRVDPIDFVREGLSATLLDPRLLAAATGSEEDGEAVTRKLDFAEVDHAAAAREQHVEVFAAHEVRDDF